MADDLDFDGMIAALEAKVSALQEAILAIKKAKDAMGGLSTPSARIIGPTDIHPDTFTGMTIAEAAEKYLRMVGRPARPTESLVDALLKGGLQRVAPASVSSILVRVHNAEGPVVRVQKGMWGLAEWYPKRPPKLVRRVTKEDGTTKTPDGLIEEKLEEMKTEEEEQQRITAPLVKAPERIKVPPIRTPVRE